VRTSVSWSEVKTVGDGVYGGKTPFRRPVKDRRNRVRSTYASPQFHKDACPQRCFVILQIWRVAYINKDRFSLRLIVFIRYLCNVFIVKTLKNKKKLNT